MKKQYTKKQITEAIAYWKKQLELGNYKQLNETTHTYNMFKTLDDVFEDADECFINTIRDSKERYEILKNFIKNNNVHSKEIKELLKELIYSIADLYVLIQNIKFITKSQHNSEIQTNMNQSKIVNNTITD